MNNAEREMWINNVEYLYKWKLSYKGSMRNFIKENRAEIDEYINNQLNKKGK